jgi:aminoglycoside phosphotransferase (APT) family kinase protein
VSELDPHEIIRELGFAGPHSASVLAENRGKAVWRMEGGDGIFALRILRPDEQETAAAEQRSMEAARAAGAPAPQVVATGSWQRRPVMLLSWCEGQTLRAAIQARPWAAFRLGVACGREQARLHAAPAPPSLASTRWLTRFGPLDPELVERLEGIEMPRRALIHLDFHTDNVLVAGGEVTGLVDWTNACAGDPRADLARTWSLLTHRSRGGLRARAAALLWRAVAAGWDRGYQQVAGSQRDMLLFRIWALTGLLQTSSEFTSLEAELAGMRERAGLSPVRSTATEPPAG